jgi:hypothetical protein
VTRNRIPEWALSDQPIDNRAFRLVDIVGADGTIANKRFVDCTIYGPAVLILQNGELVDCSLGGPADALLWPIDGTRERVIGAVAAIECSFIGCTFQGVGFAGKADFIAMLQASVQTPGLSDTGNVDAE